jgi:HK97 family phage major capsid protein
MDKIQAKQEEIKNLVSAMEGMEQGTPEFQAELDKLTAAQTDLENIKKQADEFSRIQQSLSSFKKPKSVQTGPVANVQVRDGFEADPKKGFKCAGEFLSTIAQNTNGKQLNLNADPRLAHVGALMTSGQHNTTNDGLMIPAELLPEINVIGKDASQDWLSRFRINQTSSNAVEIRRDAATTRGGSVGLVVGRAAELAQLSSTRQSFEKTNVKVDKMYIYTEVSDEDLNDFPLLQSNLFETAPELLRIKKGEEVLFGNGVSEALGFKNGGDVATITRNAANDVKAEDIANMLARHLVSGNSFWMVNQAVWSKLPLMSIANQPVYQADFSVSPWGNLMGLPVYTTEDCEALGSVGDVYLVNPDAYFALEKAGGDNFASSMHVKFDYDAMAFRWTSRFGGAPKFNAPYTPRDKNSTTKATLSNFCVLGSA